MAVNKKRKRKTAGNRVRHPKRYIQWRELVISFLATIVVVMFVQQEIQDLYQFYRREDVIQTVSESISHVPVIVQGGEEPVYIEGLPSTVTVYIEGNKDLVEQIDFQQMWVTTDDITTLTEDSGLIRLKLARPLSENVSVTISPSHVYITVRSAEL